MQQLVLLGKLAHFFVSRLKNLLSFYMMSRECDSLDKLVDLVVADRLKDTLSGPCLKYCLSIEGQTGLKML